MKLLGKMAEKTFLNIFVHMNKLEPSQTHKSAPHVKLTKTNVHNVVIVKVIKLN